MSSQRKIVLLAFSVAIIIGGLLLLQRNERNEHFAHSNQRPYGKAEDYKKRNSSRFFGFINGLDTSTQTISFDEALISPDSTTADKWAKEDAGCIKENPPTDCNIPDALTPNDFYIRNTDASIDILKYSKDTVVKLYTYGQGDQELTIQQYSITELSARLYPNSPTENKNYSNEELNSFISLYQGSIPAWIEIADGSVVSIEEQYLP